MSSRQRLLNLVAGIAFAIGGSLFAIGAAAAFVNPETSSL